MLSYVSAAWQRCIEAARSVSGRLRGPRTTAQSDESFAVRTDSTHEGTGDPTLFAYAQTLWMLVTLVLLVALALLSARLYFVVSFIGLLVNRLLFAPRERTGRWWRLTNYVTWLCFAVLSYLVYLRVETAMRATGSA